MYTSIPNNQVIVSNESGSVPSLEDVALGGAAINTADKVIYFITEIGDLDNAPVSDKVIIELMGANAGLRGKLTYIAMHGLHGTIVRMNGIGRIVEAGDLLRLPYGKVTQVLFVSSDDTVVVKDALEPAQFEQAEVMRWSVPLSELDNPSLLSTLMSTVIFGDPSDDIDIGASEWKPEVNTVVIFGDRVLHETFSGTGQSDASDSFYRNGLAVDVHVRTKADYTLQQMRDDVDGVLDEFELDRKYTVVIFQGGYDVIGEYPDNEDVLKIGVEEIASKIRSRGFLLAMPDLTDQSIPSTVTAGLYNHHVVNHLIRDYANFTLAYHKLSIDNRGMWAGLDGVLPSRVGKLLNIEHMVLRIRPFVRNVAILRENSLKDVLFCFGAKPIMANGENHPVSDVPVALFNTDYTPVPSAYVTFSNVNKTGNQGRGNTSDSTQDSLDLYNHEALKQYVYTQPGGKIGVLLKKAALNPDSMYRVRVTSSRAITGATRRSDVYIANEPMQMLDATLNPQGIIDVTVSGLALAANGITAETSSGASYGYVSIIRITRIDDDLSGLGVVK